MDFFQDDPAAFSRYLAGEPFVQDDKHEISMHFGFDATQSRMRKNDPNKLVLGYTQTMMGFLLFQPKPERIAMIGLGGGSLAKYCLRHLPDSHFTAVEINPSVIALRNTFEIPPDGTNFTVLCDDGAVYVQNQDELVDVLLVDGFDRDGLPGQLGSAKFYDDCYEKLQEGGILVVNLWGGDFEFNTYCARIRDSFQGQAIVVDSEDWGNKVVFAYKGQSFPPSRNNLSERVKNFTPYHTFSLQAVAQKIVKTLNSADATRVFAASPF
jgi:spermidine synthase